MTMSQLGIDLADKIAIKDARFDQFWNYKPIPLLIEGPDAYFRSGCKVKALVGANRCIDGSMKVFDPSIQAYRVIQDTKSEFSVLAWNGQRLVSAKAGVPFVKGEADMMRVVFANGNELLCTLDHRILSSHMHYVSLRSIQAGDSVFLPESNSDTYQPVYTIENIGKRKVWDFEVEKYHNYWAGGVINHNSTKTFAGIFECIMVYTGMIPPSLHGIYPWKLPRNRPRQVRIILTSFTKHWPLVIMPILLGDPASGGIGMLPEAWSDYDPLTHIFTGPDGSQLSIDAFDPHDRIEPTALRGSPSDHIYIDELNQEVVFKESITRSAACKDGPKTVTLGYCPQEGTECWTYKGIYLRNYDKNTNQKLPTEKRDPSIFVQRVTMRDNPSITPEELQRQIEQLNPWEIAFRVEGVYSDRSANPYFNMRHIFEWEKNKFFDGVPVIVKELEVNAEKGTFKGEIQKIDNSHITEDTPVWHLWDVPRFGHRYCMTADSAEGNDESDNQVCDIWDDTDRKKPVQVAQLLIQKLKPGEFGVQCCCMANLWGKCLLVPEAMGFSGGIFIDRVRHYSNVYRRSTTGAEEEEKTDKLGYAIMGIKGPLLEDSYKTLVDCHQIGHCPFNSRISLMEHAVFEERVSKTATGMTKVIHAARKGDTDDCVISTALNFRILRHEYHLLSPCRFSKDVIHSSQKVKIEKKIDGLERKSFAMFRDHKMRTLDQCRKIR